MLADLYLRAGASPARPPSKETIWRVLTDADAFDATVGGWLMSSLPGELELSAPAAEEDDPAQLVPHSRPGVRPCRADPARCGS